MTAHCTTALSAMSAASDRHCIPLPADALDSSCGFLVPHSGIRGDHLNRHTQPCRVDGAAGVDVGLNRWHTFGTLGEHLSAAIGNTRRQSCEHFPYENAAAVDCGLLLGRRFESFQTHQILRNLRAI